MASLGYRLTVTDALAHFCLGQAEAGGKPWDEWETFLAAAEAQKPFVSWIERLRDAGRLRNDDVTLLAIEL